jgi:hypothetical protein
MPSVIMLGAFYAHCHNFHYAECHYNECHYAECRGASYRII